MPTTRVRELSAPTRRNSTMAAPMRASEAEKASAVAAARRGQLRCGKRRKAHAASPSVRTRLVPLRTRWVNSIRVFSTGAVGKSSPLQVGQLAPQPSPLREARTRPPHATTNKGEEEDATGGAPEGQGARGQHVRSVP